MWPLPTKMLVRGPFEEPKGLDGFGPWPQSGTIEVGLQQGLPTIITLIDNIFSAIDWSIIMYHHD